jgi:hypothetical protein
MHKAIRIRFLPFSAQPGKPQPFAAQPRGSAAGCQMSLNPGDDIVKLPGSAESICGPAGDAS